MNSKRIGFKETKNLLKTTFKEWSQDKAPRLCAALAYYTIFSIAPFLVICLALASFFFGDVASSRITSEIEGVVGTQAAEAIASMVKAKDTQDSSLVATFIGFGTLIFGALGLFAGLQDALNTVWGVAPKPGRGIRGTLSTRLTSFGILLGTCFLLLVSLVASTILAGMGDFISQFVPLSEWTLQFMNLALSFGIITLLFAMIYKVLPDAKISWSDVWVGAAVTSFLFGLGKFLIGYYLGRASVSSSYGAAGSVIVVLLWVYYSTQILLFGAEFTKVYANRFGSRVTPSEHAIALTDELRAEQGIPRKEVLEKAIREDSVPSPI